MNTVFFAAVLIAAAAITGWWWIIPAVCFVLLALWIKGAKALADADLDGDFWGDDGD